MIYNISKTRNAIEMLYDWRCKIIEKQNIKDDTTKINSTKEVIILEDIPCRISFKNTNNSAIQTDKQAIASQEVKLIISPDITVKEGSKIIAKKLNSELEYEYICSGITSIYNTHQEIPIKKFLGWI